MAKNKFLFWQRWLLVIGSLITLFGLFMALFNDTVLFAFFNAQIDPVFWDSQVLPSEWLAFRTWVYGVWGATVAGWGLMITFLTHTLFRKQVLSAWKALVAALLVWYVIDTIISFGYEVYFNAVFNTILLVLAGLPLGFTLRYFKGD
jgi:hypothetical protein